MKKLLILIIFILFFLFILVNFTLAKAIEIKNPLKTESLTDLLENIYNYVVDFAIAISSVIIVWAGYLFLSAQGDEEKIKKAKRLLTWAVIGLVVSILAKGIALVIKKILVGS